MGKFKIGDKVLDNGKKSGHTFPRIGTIVAISPPDSWLWYNVQWSNGEIEEFHKGELSISKKR